MCLENSNIDSLKLKLKSNDVNAINREDLTNIFYLISNDKHEFELATCLFKKYLKTKLNNTFVISNSDSETKSQFDNLLFTFSKSYYDLKLEDVAKNILDDKVWNFNNH